MILAVLEARCGISFAQMDVHLNIAGGMRINEPAGDLAVAAALLSALRDKPLPPEGVVFGEISLSGAIRAVSQADMRLKEAAKLGFTSAITPSQETRGEKSGMNVTRIDDLAGFIEHAFGNG
jgi:DNA repair protein RadA/Sms